MQTFHLVLLLSVVQATCHAAENCAQVQREANGTLPSGTYTVDHKGHNITLFCQYHDGYGYSFLSPTTSGDIDVDMSVFYDVTDEVIIQHTRSNGLQYKVSLQQLARYSDIPISVQFNRHSNYASPSDNIHTLGPYLYIGGVPLQTYFRDRVVGWRAEGTDVPKTGCGSNWEYADNYITLMFDQGSTHKGQYVLGWADWLTVTTFWYHQAVVVADSEELPDEFFAVNWEVATSCDEFCTYGARNRGLQITLTAGVKFALPACFTPLTVPGSTFIFDGTGEGATVTYTCDDVYSLMSGDLVRTCQGGWTGDLPVCGANGGLTQWSEWECPVNCESGSLTRTRTCTNPVPLNGDDCVGETNQTRSCSNTADCQVNGNWSDWSYGPCDVTCGYGSRSKTRSCDNPAPVHGGLDCAGNATDTEECMEQLCSGINQCGAGRFTCGNGTMKCITDSFRCDCEDDCDDGSDEDVTWAGCDADKCSAAAGFFAGSLVVWYSLYHVVRHLF